MPWIVQLLIGLAFNVASTLIQQLTAQDQKTKQSGVRGSIQTGGDNPLAFIMGRYATSGQLEYAGTWGNNGDTPNAYFTKVISVSDLPVRGLSGLYVGSERVTILSGGGAMGSPVQQYRVDGKDHLWIKFYDGTQTDADPFLLDKFGSDPDRPWQSDMVGLGVAYVIITALVNRELFSGLPDYLIEVDGIPLTDRRGGTAQHDNPLVGIDTLLGGLSYGGQWICGPQNIGTSRRPLTTWQPQMNKCDVLVGGQKQFRFGYEVVVDQEPHAIIGELLKACQGRIAEIGGIYKPLVGAPDAPVVSFTDEDIVVTEGQTYDPFPGLESTYNGITATYPEPAEAWENKEAPPRYRSDLEALDDNRPLPFSTSYAAVPYPVQVQRLMRAAIEETRRFRKHVHTMPPEWWEYEPLDAVVWTSERNGYENKVFLITAQDDLNNGNQIPALQEQDPADYDWSSDYELPWDVVPLVISRPQPQVITGWQVFPAVLEDNAGNARRPSIEVQFDGGRLDVRAVRVQVRLSSSGDLVLDTDLPYDYPAGLVSIVLNGTFLPNTAYEVRGKYVPFGGRATEWSAWLPVTSPDVRLGTLDIYEGAIVADLPDSLIEWQEYIGPSVRDVADELQRIARATAEQDLGNYRDKATLERKLASSFETNRAEYLELITAATGPGSAIVGRIETLEAEVGDNLAEAIDLLETKIETVDGKVTATAQSITALRVALGGSSANVNIRFRASAGPSGFAARYAIQAAVNDGAYRAVGFFMDVPANASLPGRIVLQAQQTVIVDASNNILALFTSDGKLATARIPSIATNMLAAGAITTDKLAADSVTAAKLNVTTLSAITANLGTVTAGLARSADSKLQVDFNNTRILVLD